MSWWRRPTLEILAERREGPRPIIDRLRDPVTGEYCAPWFTPETERIRAEIKRIRPEEMERFGGEVEPGLVGADEAVPMFMSIVDTGLMAEHPGLKWRIEESVNLSREPDAEDRNGHGTLCALIAARLMSPHARFLNVKVMDADGRGDPQALVRALRWLVAFGERQGLDAIKVTANLSVGVYSTRWLFFRCRGGCKVCKAAAEAGRKGILINAAVGNTPGLTACPATVGLVARSPNVIAVGSSDYEKSGVGEVYVPSEHFGQKLGSIDLFRVDEHGRPVLWRKDEELDRAVAGYTAWVEVEGHTEDADALAKNLLNRGARWATKGSDAEALADFDRAVTLLRRLAERPGRDGVTQALARALTFRGTGLTRLGRASEGLRDLDEALPRLDEGEPDLDTAQCLTSRAAALSKVGRNAEARRDSDRAVEMLRAMAAERPRDFAPWFGTALYNRAEALFDDGDPGAARRDYDEAARIFARLAAQDGRNIEHAVGWAQSLTGRGAVSAAEGRYAEAIPDLEQAVALYRDWNNLLALLEVDRTDLAPHLARTLYDLGQCLTGSGRHEPAAAALDEAVGLLDGVTQEDPLHPLRAELARFLAGRAYARLQAGQDDAALADYGRAIALFDELRARAGRTDLIGGLAAARSDRGGILFRRGDYAGALQDFNESITLGRARALSGGGDAAALRLASDLHSRAKIWEDSGRPTEALADLDRALALYREREAAFDRQGVLPGDDSRAGLTKKLGRSLNTLGSVLGGLGQYGAAAEAFDEAIRSFRSVVSRPDSPPWFDYAMSLNNRGACFLNQRDFERALPWLDQALEVYQRLVEGEGRNDAAPEYAKALADRGVALSRLNRQVEAVRDLDRSIDLYTRLLQAGGPGSERLAAGLQRAHHFRDQAGGGTG